MFTCVMWAHKKWYIYNNDLLIFQSVFSHFTRFPSILYVKLPPTAAFSVVVFTNYSYKSCRVLHKEMLCVDFSLFSCFFYQLLWAEPHLGASTFMFLKGVCFQTSELNWDPAVRRNTREGRMDFSSMSGFASCSYAPCCVVYFPLLLFLEHFFLLDSFPPPSVSHHPPLLLPSLWIIHGAAVRLLWFPLGLFQGPFPPQAGIRATATEGN